MSCVGSVMMWLNDTRIFNARIVVDSDRLRCPLNTGVDVRAPMGRVDWVD
jgi:hypothetical protein